MTGVVSKDTKSTFGCQVMIHKFLRYQVDCFKISYIRSRCNQDLLWFIRDLLLLLLLLL